MRIKLQSFSTCRRYWHLPCRIIVQTSTISKTVGRQSYLDSDIWWFVWQRSNEHEQQ
jgi:hypothetical protein